MSDLVQGVARNTQAEAAYTTAQHQVDCARFRAYHREFWQARESRDYGRMQEVTRHATALCATVGRLVRMTAPEDARSVMSPSPADGA